MSTDIDVTPREPTRAIVPDLRLLKCTTCGVRKATNEFGRTAYGAPKRACLVCSPGDSAARAPRAPRSRTRPNLPAPTTPTPVTGETGHVPAMTYASLFKQQGGACACCGQPEVFLTDAGEPRRLVPYYEVGKHAQCRGLVCTRCVTGLAMFNDSPVLLARAIGFLSAPLTGGRVELRYHAP